MSFSQQRTPWIILFLWLFCITQVSFAQRNNFKLFEKSNSRSGLQQVWGEEFSNNLKDWPQYHTHSLYSRIRKGKYEFAARTNHPFQVTKPLIINQVDQFQIEMDWKVIICGKDAYNGLVFGGDYHSNGYALSIDRQQTISLIRFDHRNEKVLLEENTHGLWKAGAYNKVSLHQTETSWEIYLNEQFLFSHPRQRLFGGECGLISRGNNALEVQSMHLLEGEQINHYEATYQDEQGISIDIIEPYVLDGTTYIAKSKYQNIRGKVNSQQEIQSFYVNDTKVTVDYEGYFSITCPLDSLFTHMHLEARNYAGARHNMNFNILFQDPVEAVVYPSKPKPSAHSDFKTSYSQSNGFHSESFKTTGRGENYLLIIGVNEYTVWQPLYNAVKDVQDVKSTLIKHYGFKSSNVLELIDEDATRENIMDAFEQMQVKLTPDDNLVIYYAGHGYYNRETGLGYWVPVNSRRKKVADYIGNSTIHDYIRSIDSKHTFLIADACYAGSFFTHFRSNQFLLDARSRWAFTSGDIEKVWDGQPGENSPFAKNLIYFMKNYQGRSLPIDQLIQEVSESVKISTTQTPQGSPLKMAGDKGGVMVLKKVR
ncbi:MAG: caspase family protein [Bacteroidota bacterium]